ncbi:MULTISPECIES: mannosyltransferase [Chitinophagaceae]
MDIEVHLHCVQYANHQPQHQLEKVCHSVYYYKRKKIFPLKFWGIPYIVESRIIPELIAKLNEDNTPVLIEGIHGTGIIPYLNCSDRKISIRLHNVEFVYYKHLAKTTSHFFKKIYYSSESRRLEKWERKLVENNVFNSVSLLDCKIYEQELLCKNIVCIPLFLPNWYVAPKLGQGAYCLYQGNLDVEENQEAVKWLVEKVFSDISFPLYIAGKSSGAFVKQYQYKKPSIKWIENPSDAEMNALIADAQIHLLPSFNATGIKIKLLNALYNGRFCLVNTATIKDSGLEQLCIVANTVADFQEKMKELYNRRFTEAELDFRKSILNNIYNNKKNAILLKQQLFGE